MAKEAIKDDAQETPEVENTQATVGDNEAEKSEVKQSVITKRQEALDNVEAQFYGDLLNKDAITHPREHEEFNSRIGFEDEEEEAELADPTPAPVPEKYYRNANGDWVTKIKVNGEEQEMSLEKVLAIAQKHESADRRLQEASQKQKALNEMAHELQLKEARLRQQRQQPLPSNNQDVKSDEAYAKDVQEALERMYDGEISEAADRLNKIMSERGKSQQMIAPTIDEQYLIDRAAEQAFQRTQQVSNQRMFESSIASGKKWMAETYPQFMKDPELYDMVNAKTATIMQENPNLSPDQIIKQAANRIAELTGNKAVTRESEKTKLRTTIKQQSSLAYKVPEKKEPDNTPLGVINEMKSQRMRIRNSPG